MLHILNGDSTLAVFERSGLDGTACVFADVLHEGPVLPDPTDVAFTEARIRHAVQSGWGAPDVAVSHHAAWTRGLTSAAGHDEVVLWFEHDLFDQLLLLHHVEWFARNGLVGSDGPVVSLICIDRFDGVPDFHGLGQLSPEQLASLLAQRRPLSGAQVAAARAAWSGLTSADPQDLLLAHTRDVGSLPFLAPALRRLLEEYPNRGSGLARTELQILRAVAGGAVTPATAFRAQAALEESVFLGDTVFWDIVRRLAATDSPPLLLDVQPAAGRLPDGTLSLTPFGGALIAGESDFVEANGVDRWIGGVRIQGAGFPWRWDGGAGRLRRTT